jgi:hypothetical protein
VTLNQHIAQKTRRFNEFHGIGRMEDAEIEAQHAEIDADEDAALDELEAVATLIRVMKADDLIRVAANRFTVDLPGFQFRTTTTYAAIALEAAAGIRSGAPYVTIRYSEDGVFFSELWAKAVQS